MLSISSDSNINGTEPGPVQATVHTPATLSATSCCDICLGSGTPANSDNPARIWAPGSRLAPQVTALRFGRSHENLEWITTTAHRSTDLSGGWELRRRYGEVDTGLSTGDEGDDTAARIGRKLAGLASR